MLDWLTDFIRRILFRNPVTNGAGTQVGDGEIADAIKKIIEKVLEIVVNDYVVLFGLFYDLWVLAKKRGASNV